MADHDRYRGDHDRYRGNDDRHRGRAGEGDGRHGAGGSGQARGGREPSAGAGYGRQGGYDQGGREDSGRYAADYGREDRGGYRGEPPRGREDQGGDPRGTGGGGGYGRERSDYGPRVNEDIGQGAYGQGFVGNQGRGYGYGFGAERDTGRNAQAYDDQPDRGFMERAADSVASWFGDEDAGRRLERDHRGRGPKGYKRSDDRIREDVSDRLYDDPHVDASDIEVAVSGGEVTLTGTVDDRNARRRAEDVAERVSGVTYVQNNLRVRRPGSPAAETPVAGPDPAKAGGTASPASTNLGSSGGTATGLGATGGTLPGTGAAGAGSVADPSTAGSSHRTTGL